MARKKARTPPPSVTDVLATRIRELREARGLSQEEVAVKAHLDRADLSRIENGKGPRSLGTTRLNNIAQALGVTLSDLVQGA